MREMPEEDGSDSDAQDESIRGPVVNVDPLFDRGQKMTNQIELIRGAVIGGAVESKRGSAGVGVPLPQGSVIRCTDELADQIDAWRTEFKTRLETTRKDGSEELSTFTGSPGVQTEQVPGEPRLVDTGPPSPESIACNPKFRLNAKQRLAFYMIVDRLQADLLNETRLPQNRVVVPQLKMFIGGVGGTGKSHIIKAVLHWCAAQGRAELVHTMAPTGSAASVIDGRTLHSFLGINPMDSGPVKHRTQTRERISRLLANAKLLVVDEISMVKCTLLAQVNSVLRSIKKSEVDFGGMHVVFLGDFAQMPPIGHEELYNRTMARPSVVSNYDSMPLKVRGRWLWEDVDNVILLEDQMRQSDAEYYQMLQDVRRGVCTNASWKLLQSRIIPEGERLGAEWHSAPMVVTRNPVRTAVNFHHVVAEGERLKRPVLVVAAKDMEHTAAGDAAPRAGRARKFRRLVDSMTNNQPGFLPLLIGQEYILKYNEGTEFSIANGCRCTLESVVLDELEPPTPPTGLHMLKYMPKMLWLRFPDSRMKRALTNVPNFAQPTQLFPLVPRPLASKKDKVIVDGFHCSFQRTQFQLVPSRALTVYGAQGQTYNKAVIDLDIDTKTPSQAAYVMLSRVKCRHGLHIVGEFPRSILTRLPPKPLLEEERRLEQLPAATPKKTAVFVEKIP